jgi:hypothetical protein
VTHIAFDGNIAEADLLTQLQSESSRPVPGSGLAQRVGAMLPHSLRPQLRIWMTSLLRPLQRVSANRLASRSPLKLNLGCGALPLKGWVNVDLAGLPVDLIWDLRYPLPFPANSVDTIFHEHGTYRCVPWLFVRKRMLPHAKARWGITHRYAGCE